MTLIEKIEALREDVCHEYMSGGQQEVAVRQNQKLDATLKIIRQHEQTEAVDDIRGKLTKAVCNVTCSVVEMDDKITPLIDTIIDAIRPYLRQPEPRTSNPAARGMERAELVRRMEAEYQRYLGEKFGYEAIKSGSWFRDAMGAALAVVEQTYNREEL